VNKYVCVHGHFYQPPRENPWLERIEQQPSAYPFHDWNERIDAECYGPNARARILDGERRVVDVVNVYARISFNVGPTLLSWMEDHSRRTYASILEADDESRARFGGHGSAIAQVYAHPILPLASAIDRRTQVAWGVADFRHRFGREPEGMWLPETAADIPSLEALAAAGIAFTILAPDQCAATRAPDETVLTPASKRRVDTRRAYRVDLPSGRSIAVFFYDGPTSRAVAFDQLLHDGTRFAERLIAGVRESGGLAHIATDGETYGHHHRHGEMALAWALDAITRAGEVEVTNYGQFLERHPPTWTATIVEPSAWSCAHGVGRWSRDCGCRTGGGSDQAWRGPLRAAFENMREAVDPLFARLGGEIFVDPWAARDAYVSVVLDRARDNVEAFLRAHAKRPLGEAEVPRALALLEMQRNAMLAFTSCGWFFDHVDGLEPTQDMMYAVRAAELAGRFGATDVEPALLRDLEAAHSRQPGAVTGRQVVEKRVLPARFDAARVVAAHDVIALADLGYRAQEPGWSVSEVHVPVSVRRGDLRLHAGTFRVREATTSEETVLRCAAVHKGGFEVEVAVRPAGDDAAWESVVASLSAAVAGGRVAEASSLLATIGPVRDARDIPSRDDTAVLAERVVAAEVARAEVAHRAVFERCAPMLRALATMGVSPPRALRTSSKVILDADIARAAESDPPDVARIARLVGEARAEDVRLDEGGLSLTVQRLIARTAGALEVDPADVDRLRRLGELLDLARLLGPQVDVSRAQDFVWMLAGAGRGGGGNLDSLPGEARAAFSEVAEKARVQVVRADLKSSRSG
jgi:hypothetical protein